MLSIHALLPLFTHLARHPQSPTANADLDLIRFVRDHLDRMKDSHAGADRLWRVAAAFVRMAETLLGEQGPHADKPLVGKRKRGPGRPSAETGGSSAEGFVQEPAELDFLRPLQQPPQPMLDSGSAGIGVSAGVGSGGERMKVGATEYFPPVSSDLAIPSPATATSYSADTGSFDLVIGDGSDQTLLAAENGPLDFDWVLWDQSAEPDFGAMLNAFVNENAAAGINWPGGVGGVGGGTTTTTTTSPAPVVAIGGLSEGLLPASSPN